MSQHITLGKSEPQIAEDVFDNGFCLVQDMQILSGFDFNVVLAVPCQRSNVLLLTSLTIWWWWHCYCSF